MFIDDKTDLVYGIHKDDEGTVRTDDGREVVGWMPCDDCKAPVPVKLNRGSNPYYGCAQCNNQHRPQTSTSRELFYARMNKLKGGEDDKEKDSAEPCETGGPSGSPDGTGSGKRRGRVGCFGG